MKLRPDEDIRRFRPKWIGIGGGAGVKPVSMPFQASYLAWGVCSIVFGAIIGVQIVTNTFHGLPLLQFVLALLVTSYLMKIVSTDVPIRSLWVPLWHELTAPRKLPTVPHRRAVCTHRIRRAT